MKTPSPKKKPYCKTWAKNDEHYEQGRQAEQDRILKIIALFDGVARYSLNGNEELPTSLLFRLISKIKEKSG